MPFISFCLHIADHRERPCPATCIVAVDPQLVQDQCVVYAIGDSLDEENTVYAMRIEGVDRSRR